MHSALKMFVLDVDASGCTDFIPAVRMHIKYTDSKDLSDSEKTVEHSCE